MRATVANAKIAMPHKNGQKFSGIRRCCFSEILLFSHTLAIFSCCRCMHLRKIDEIVRQVNCTDRPQLLCIHSMYIHIYVCVCMSAEYIVALGQRLRCSSSFHRFWRCQCETRQKAISGQRSAKQRSIELQ